jgi:hypothetical protein
MTLTSVPSSGHKDLQDLRDLSRSPVLSYLRKQAPPTAPRLKTAALKPSRYPSIGAFTLAGLWNWVREYIHYRIGPRHLFQEYAKAGSDNGIYALQGDTGDSQEVRIALAGDWGTGTDEAALVAGLIDNFKPHYSIHLGDVYYVGDEAEVNENFLGIKDPDNQYAPCFWPHGSNGAFALNGNHEMYARGFAYFDLMLPTLGPIVNGKAQPQGASFFCLENKYWRLIALDTGYNSIGIPVLEYIFRPDCALPEQLLTWLRTVVRPRPDDPRGIILLSHHQYFSRYDTYYTKPAKQLVEFFSRPVLWFWGHEHRMTIYEKFCADDGIEAFGRCIGHGGMPVDLPPDPPPHPDCPKEFVDERLYPNDENLSIGFNGFAKMSLKGNLLTIQYVDVLGALVFSETWSAGNGILTRVS